MPDFSLFGDEHVRQYEATGGKVGHDWNGTSCLVLRTRGRKTGEVRKFPLIYARSGDECCGRGLAHRLTASAVDQALSGCAGAPSLRRRTCSE